MARAAIAGLVLALAGGGCSFDGPDTVDFNSTTSSSLESGGTQFGATIDGAMWYWNVSWNDVKDTPNWEPGEEPAISMPKAIQLALAEMPKYTDAPSAYALEDVTWSPITHCCDPTHPRKWVYVVTFERSERFPSGARGTMTIPVLLDGRAIEGKKESPR